MRIENKRAWVEVELIEHTSGVPVRFMVRGSSGYVAVLPACHADDCLSGKHECCTTRLTTHYNHQHAVKVNGKTSNSVDAWLKHTRTHCHDWHWPTVERFAGDVLATYGTTYKPSKTIGVGPGALRLSAYALEHSKMLAEKYAEQAVGA